MTLTEIERKNIYDSDEAANIRSYLKQPCFRETFSIRPIGVVRENDSLVLYVENLKNNPELSQRGSIVKLFFKSSDADAPYKVMSGLSLS